MEMVTPWNIRKGRYKNMKKSNKIIGIIATMAFIAVRSFYLGTTQAETITDVQTVTEIVAPDGCIDSTSKEFYDNFIDMRKVTDYAATDSGLMIYLDDGNGYYWER